MASTKRIPRYVALTRVLLTFLFIALGVLILTSPNFMFPEAASDGVQKLAAGWIGSLVAYWFSD